MTTPASSPSDAGDQPICDWGALLAAHAGWLRKVILARTGESQAVDEVFQRVALAAVRQQAPLVDPSKAVPWLHRLAVIQSARYRRTLGRERRAMQSVKERSPHLGNGYADNALAWLLARERQAQTQAALARLSGADAEILLLKYGERWKSRQIAERLGITEKAVDARLVRARGRLRHELTLLGITGDNR